MSLSTNQVNKILEALADEIAWFKSKNEPANTLSSIVALDYAVKLIKHEAAKNAEN